MELFNGDRVRVWEGEKVLDTMVAVVTHIVNVPNATERHTQKWLKG